MIFTGAKAREGETSGHKLVAAASKTETGSHHAGTSLLVKRPKYSSSLHPDKSQVKYDEVAIDCEYLILQFLPLKDGKAVSEYHDSAGSNVVGVKTIIFNCW